MKLLLLLFLVCVQSSEGEYFPGAVRPDFRETEKQIQIAAERKKETQRLDMREKARIKNESDNAKLESKINAAKKNWTADIGKKLMRISFAFMFFAFLLMIHVALPFTGGARNHTFTNLNKFRKI
jgi:hypothetical protein